MNDTIHPPLPFPFRLRKGIFYCTPSVFPAAGKAARSVRHALCFAVRGEKNRVTRSRNNGPEKNI